MSAFSPLIDPEAERATGGSLAATVNRVDCELILDMEARA